ncbi:MAG: ABC transporter permease [Kordiimonadaceae bacterium]|nr:ABC transporter permease [Kordiimonadaceae bacterium]MBO6567767.1 ABC transporter permease [Kordiimonadaceae bacterium]MBO6963018.1 ABC transporter permease [Kordiimonadaceae bacterium]
MLFNYFSVSFRNLLKHKLFSIVNIAGLSVGLSAVLLISLYIWDEVNYDSHLKAGGNIYKLETHTNFPGRGPRDNPVTGGAAAPGLLAEHPELIKDAARMLQRRQTVTIGGEGFSERVYHVDANIFELFDLTLIAGSQASALTDASSVAISQSTAIRYFGRDDVVGETLRLDDGRDYRVSSVFEDFPENTHVRPNLMFPISASNRDLVSHDEGWWSLGYTSYVQLQSGVDAASLAPVISDFINRHLEAPAEGVVMSEQYNYNVIPMEKVHFDTAAPDAGNALLLQGFAAIAFVILSIATFNFMNMSISRTMVRTREVAVRKVFGAGERNIINLLLNETLLTVLISLLLAVVITEASLAWFNGFVAKLMDLGTLATPEFGGALFGLVLLVSLGAGFYPAKIMADLRPATVLRGGRSASRNMSRLAKVLVTAQFAVAIGLMITATVIYQQINYSQAMDPGYQKENMLLLEGLSHPRVSRSQPSIADRIAAVPGVTNVALVDQAPGGRYGWMEGISVVDGEQLDQPIAIRGVSVGDNFLDAFGMQLVAGRALTSEREADISRERGAEQSKEAYNILVNEQALRTLGLGTAENAVGKMLGNFTIVGVLRDYVWGTSRGTIPPAMYVMDQTVYRLLAVRFRTSDVQALTSAIDAEWATLVQGRPVRRQFMDDRIASLYRLEVQQGELFALFAGLSILVSCIGLYGLASFTVAGRTKEIGVRKVLGASTSMVTRHILWDFSKPVLLANLIAWPVAFYLAREWLAEFTYAIELSAMPFVGAAVLALVVASFTVGGHAIRVALANPVTALRTD